MSTDTDNTLRLHHSIKEPVQPPSSDAGNDFAAAFSGDDDAPLPELVETAAETGDPGDENISAQGVDTPENGAQVPPQPQEFAIDDLPEDLRQQVAPIIEARNKAVEEAARVRRDLEAQTGRVAPVQQRLAQLERENAQLRQQSPAPQSQPQPQGAAAPPSAVAQAQAHFESKSFKDYEALYPEDAAIQKQSQLVLAQAQDAQAMAVLQQLEQLNRSIHGESERINRFEQERMSAAKRAEIDELTTTHPDWQQINESDEFWDWFNGKTSLFGIRSEDEMRRRVNDKAFVIEALNLYKASPQYASPATHAAPAAHVAEAPQQATSAALRLASAPRNTGGGVTRPKGPASAGDEFMAAFNSDD